MKQTQEEQVRLLETCSACKKQITRQSRVGSFTSLIFASARCKCEVPLLQPSKELANRKPDESDSIELHTHSTPVIGERFEVLSLLGEGGMGQVWKIHDKVLDKVLAVKILRQELALDTSAEKRFEQETQAAMMLTHSNMVAVYGHGKDSTGSPYLLMDYLEGENLAELIRREGFLEPTRVMDISAQVCEALDYAHSKNIVHRDIKPSNIMIVKTADGNDMVKLVDFGIAKVMPTVNEQTNGLTQTGDLFGSLHYMSPEQCLGEKLDARSDIYSLGCVMYEALTGKLAYDAENPVKIILNHLSNEIPELTLNHNSNQSLNLILAAALQREQGRRYQNASEMHTDLIDTKNGQSPAHAHKITSKETDNGYFQNINLSKPTVGLILSLAAFICNLIGYNNTPALAMGACLTLFAVSCWCGYNYKLAKISQLKQAANNLLHAKLSSTPVREMKIASRVCLWLSAFSIPAILLQASSELSSLPISIGLGFTAVFLACIWLSINVGFEQKGTHTTSPIKYLWLNIVAATSPLFMYSSSCYAALCVGGYFKGVMYLAEHNYMAPYTQFFVAAFAGIAALFTIGIFTMASVQLIYSLSHCLRNIVTSLHPMAKPNKQLTIRCLLIPIIFMLTPFFTEYNAPNFVKGYAVLVSACSGALAIGFLLLNDILNLLDKNADRKTPARISPRQ